MYKLIEVDMTGQTDSYFEDINTAIDQASMKMQYAIRRNRNIAITCVNAKNEIMFALNANSFR